MSSSVETQSYQYTAFTSGIFTLLLIIGIYHIICIQKEHKPSQTNLTLLLIFLGLIQMVDLTLLSLPTNIMNGEWYCDIEMHIGPSLYLSFKTVLYAI